MHERKYGISSVQIFCLAFFCLLSGMMLFGGGSLAAALFAALFTSCICVLAAALCGGSTSSLCFYGAVFGKFGGAFRYIAAFFTSLSLVQTLFALSGSTVRFYSAENARVFAPVLALLCLASVAKGFARAARLAEVCAFPLFFAMALSLLGGEGQGLSFEFAEDALFGGFEIIGAVPAFFSLYLRNVTAESGKMSDFAKNSAFHPSPLASGAFAAWAALLAYSFFCYTGWGNILLSLLTWFFALSRLSLFAVALADLLAYPEKGEGAKRAFFASLFCAFWAIFISFFPSGAKTAGIFASVLFPCAVCAFFAANAACVGSNQNGN